MIWGLKAVYSTQPLQWKGKLKTLFVVSVVTGIPFLFLLRDSYWAYRFMAFFGPIVGMMALSVGMMALFSTNMLQCKPKLIVFLKLMFVVGWLMAIGWQVLEVLNFPFRPAAGV